MTILLAAIAYRMLQFHSAAVYSHENQPSCRAIVVLLVAGGGCHDVAQFCSSVTERRMHITDGRGHASGGE